MANDRLFDLEASLLGAWREFPLALPRLASLSNLYQDLSETHLAGRALITQARANLAGYARLHKVVFDKGFLDGTDLWWLDQQGRCRVVPAKANLAVTADARAQAAAGEGITRGRRGHTVRHGQGRAARTERLETEVVGMTGLTT